MLLVISIWYQRIIALSGDMKNISGNINLIQKWRAEYGGSKI